MKHLLITASVLLWALALNGCTKTEPEFAQTGESINILCVHNSDDTVCTKGE